MPDNEPTYESMATVVREFFPDAADRKYQSSAETSWDKRDADDDGGLDTARRFLARAR